jgi:phosphatidylglycerophosphate synthase
VSEHPTGTLQRRPVAARGKPWAQKFAAMLNSMRIAPNAISLAGVGFAVVAALALWRSGSAAGALRVILLLVAAAGIQLRLLCNLFDGMVAVEGGRRTAYGDLYSDVPDRISDIAIFLGAGYGIDYLPFGAVLGWAAAVAASLMAYIRLLGGSMGLTQYYCGPMGKPQRMATLTAACLVSLFEPLWRGNGQVMALALALVVVGSIAGFFRRLTLICREIGQR